MVPISARSVNGDRIVTIFSLSFFLSLWTLVSNVYPLVSCYVVCRNEMTKIRHLVIKSPRYCPRCPHCPGFLPVARYIPPRPDDEQL